MDNNIARLLAKLDYGSRCTDMAVYGDMEVNFGEVCEQAATTLRHQAERLEAMREALGDLLSWFPDKPAPAEWRLEAGERGADDAIAHARTALSDNSQKEGV